MAEHVAAWFLENLHMTKEMIVFVISMIPVLELRGGIAAAAFLKIELWDAIAYCIVGNMIPVPFILLCIRKIFRWLKKTKRFGPIIELLESKSLGEKSEKIRKYEFLGLLLFVGIPLPGTGAWTGSLIAALLHVDFKKAILAVILGVCLAAFIMCMIFYFLPWVGGIIMA